MMATKRKQITTIILCLILLAMSISCMFCFTKGNVANAQVIEEKTIEEQMIEEQTTEIDPRGISTNISIKLGIRDNNVCAVARNEFTLGSATIQVYVELFSSTTYFEVVSDPLLVCYKYTADLNIYKTLEATAPINGEQKYWRARVRYKMDDKSWASKETATYLIGADGSILN